MTADAPFALDTPEFRLVAAAAMGKELPRVAAGEVDSRIVEALVERHRFGVPVVTRLIDAGAIAVPVAGLRRARMLALEQARRTVALSRQLDAAGIAHLVVKGAVLAEQLYGDIAARASKDIDLLVDPTQLDEAGRIVEAAGLTRSDGEHGGPRRHRSYAAGAIQVELHDRLIDLPSYAPLAFDTLWPRRATVPLLGHDIPTLAPVDTLIYLAAHGSDHVWFRLKWLQDVARIVAGDRGGEVAAAARAAKAAGFDRVFTAMLLLVDDLFGIHPRDMPPLTGDRATLRAVRLARIALAAPAALAHQPTIAWLLRRSAVQFTMRRDWRYRADLLADLTTGPRSFDPADRDAWSLVHLPVRVVRLLRTRA